jgi:serine-aspartate repeat-containing protein C/D/E
VGILSTLSELCFGRQIVDEGSRGRGRPGSLGRAGSLGRRGSLGRLGSAGAQSAAGRQCQIESLEPRTMLAAGGLVPNVVLGSVYFEEATGDDSQPDVIQVSFVGGAPGTTLERLVISGDKKGDGLTEGDVFFDTAAGGLGAFQHVGLSITSANGFTVDSVSVTDGGSQIELTFSGFDAGERLVFSIDADEAQFIEVGAMDDGRIDPAEVDVNSLVEGGEFQRSTIVGQFSAGGYVDLTLSGTYWDEYDDEMAAAETATGQVLGLPKDAYSTEHDYTDRTAGAVTYAPQVPLATLSGWVYHDRSNEGSRDPATEEGIGGVTVELLDEGGNPTGITTTTSSDPATLGFYEFRNLYPGTYGVREVQPAGWLDGIDGPGTHGGAAADESAGRVDVITGAVLTFGDHAAEYNFGELLAGSIRGRVQVSTGPKCDFDNPDILLEGVQIDLLDAQGNLLDYTFTDDNGEYAFTGLRPAIYQVREHQPQEYYDGCEHVGSAGGTKYDVADVYSIIATIPITSGLDAVRYDFCELTGATLSGWVYHDRSNEGSFDRATEEGIGGVTVELLDADGNPTGITTTTSTDPATLGYYEFLDLFPGMYGVREMQPAGWLDGIDTPGNHGGTAADESAGVVDVITGAVLTYGDHATEYNFGELLPSSIAGRVQATTGARCEFDEPEILLADVQIDLLDADGAVLATTYTDGGGRYHFDNLGPGEYQVFEHQPAGYYDGCERVGSVGGQRDFIDTISRPAPMPCSTTSASTSG